MRAWLAAVACLCFSLLAGCKSAPAPVATPAPAPTLAPAPAPTPAPTTPIAPPAPERYDCGQLISGVDLHVSGDWAKETVGECWAMWSSAAEGLSLSVSALPIRVTAAGGWQFSQITDQAPALESFPVKGAAATYSGVMYRSPVEKTGGAYFGPTGWSLAVGGRTGLLVIGCNPVKQAADLEAAKEAQPGMDAACRRLLGQVTVGDIGAPVALEKS